MFKKVNHYFPVLFLGILLSSCFHDYGNAQVPSANLKFPENKSVVEIPFTRYRGWIIIKVSVNDSKDLSFILDTGAPVAILANADLKNQLNLNIIGNATVGGADPNKPKSVPLAGSVKFKIGDIVIENGLMAVGIASETIDGVDGVIGKYLFDDAVVTINWKENKLILTKPGEFIYNGSGETISIHLLPSGHIYTEIGVEKNGKKVSAKADIDLGNRTNFSINKETGASIIENEKIIPDIIVAWGANGASIGDVSTTNVTIGTVHLDNVVTAFTQSNKLIKQDGIDANIGLSILERFTPIFDYTHKKLILEKNEKFLSAFTFNKSGIILNPKKEGDYILIADIIPSSPAQENGLQKGDKIISINGKKISALSSEIIDDFIRGKASDTLEIVLLRNEKEIKVTLKMRDLI
jgi:membrane-associated protease RseP (regulator of RpoE activity)